MDNLDIILPVLQRIEQDSSLRILMAVESGRGLFTPYRRFFQENNRRQRRNACDTHRVRHHNNQYLRLSAQR